jgi:hypothetical protein
VARPGHVVVQSPEGHQNGHLVAGVSPRGAEEGEVTMQKIMAASARRSVARGELGQRGAGDGTQ